MTASVFRSRNLGELNDEATIYRIPETHPLASRPSGVGPKI
jgi:hypothetical protein